MLWLLKCELKESQRLIYFPSRLECSGVHQSPIQILSEAPWVVKLTNSLHLMPRLKIRLVTPRHDTVLRIVTTLPLASIYQREAQQKLQATCLTHKHSKHQRK